jgi:outer membrane immunogenic protein
MYGALAGVEFDINPSVFLGIEGEINDSKVSESVEDAFVLGDELRASVGREIFIGGRVGFRATPNFTVYGVGGYSNVRGKLTYDDGVTRASESDTVDGYRLGAGVEYRVGAVRLRGEYRHAEYENIDVLGVDVDPSRDQFVGAVVFGF